MKAVILAGGLGTRLRPLTFSRPKPLMPLLNKPVLKHILDHLAAHGVKEVAVTTNYLREQIRAYIGDEYLGVKIIYPIEERPLGTAGSVKNIKGFLEDTFLILQGDTISHFDLTELEKTHKRNGCLCTIASLEVEDPWNYGVMDVADDGRVTRFYEKPKKDECFTNKINTGVYVMEPRVLDYIPEDTFYDFSKDLFPNLLESGSLYSKTVSGYWIDIGRPEGLTKAKQWMLSSINTHIPGSSVVGENVEGPILVGENVKIAPDVSLKGPLVIGDNARVSNGCEIGPNSVIGSQVIVGAKSQLTGTVVFENTIISAGSHIDTSYVAEGCKVGVEGRIQSDVIIGSNCLLQQNVSIANGSRIWPNMSLEMNSLVNGTLKRFIPQQNIYDDPLWSLRTVTADEAFYFNKQEKGHISFTGLRARSLAEFNDIVRQVESNSLYYHLRKDINDFRQWSERVICDLKLAEQFQQVKRQSRLLDDEGVRKMIAELTSERLTELKNRIRPPGYV